MPLKSNLNKIEKANWLKFVIGLGVTIFIIIISITVSKKNIEVQTKNNPPQAKTVDLLPLKKQLEKTKSSRDSIAKSLEQSEKNISTLSKKAKKLKSTLNAEKKQLDELKDKRSE